MKLQEKYFDKIKNGKKIFEIRLNDEKRRLIQVGDLIKFFKEPFLREAIVVKVEGLICFGSFEEMADAVEFDKLGFDGETRESVLATYRTFYSREDEKKYGVLAIKVAV